MPTGGMIVGAAAPIVGGLLGNLFGQDDRDRQAKAQQAALEAITGLSLPTIEEQQIALEKLQSAGQLTPEMLETITQGNTELKNVSTDPRLKEAQMNSLLKLSKQGEEGFTAADQAALNQSRRGVERDVRGRNEAVLQNMAQRGMSGAGAELVAQLMNSQEGADRQAQESDRTAAMAQQNALQATMNSGTLGGQIREQDYSEKSNAARAQDLINQFNAQNSQNVAATNVGVRNRASEKNLDNAQRIADANVGLSNSAQMYNKELIGKDYDRRAQKAGMLNKAQTGAAAGHGANADATAAMWTGIGQGVGKAGLAMAGAPSMGKTAVAPAAVQSMTGEAYKDPNKMYAAHGGQVPGEALVPGDHPVNDIVDAKLSPGELIIPRSIANSSDEVIMDFINHIKKASKR